MKIDVVIGLQYGDEGKGKICHALLEQNSYTHCIRFSGGGNSGHTIYHNGKKFVTHLIPAGVFYNVKSIIGPGCVLNVDKFLEEIADLETNKINIKNNIFIAKNAHIITNKHLEQDAKDTIVGTTKTGNGPAYRDKYDRIGIRADSIAELSPYLIDMYEEFYGENNSQIRILAEGAQAFGLDIDWGEYPFVTSSHCGVGSVLLNGFNHTHIRNVYGVAKAYDTYVGSKPFQPKDPIFDKIQEIGQEFGATTGRKRQCNWLDWDLVKKAIKMNGVNKLIVNKVDILEKINEWKIRRNNEVHYFENKADFEEWIEKEVSKSGIRASFSYGPHSHSFNDSNSGLNHHNHDADYFNFRNLNEFCG